MEATKQQKKVALALIENNGKFLLIDRMDHHLKLTWAFPGGVPEGNETEEEAAIREAKGETGIDVVVKSKLLTRKHPNTFVELVYFHCEPKDLNQKPQILETDEIKGLAWVEADKVLEKFTSDVDSRIRQFVLSFAK